jgi:hypothetical protein
MIKDRAPGRWPRLLGRDLAIRKTVPGRRASEPETPFAALFRVLYAVELRKMPV